MKRFAAAGVVCLVLSVGSAQAGGRARGLVALPSNGLPAEAWAVNDWGVVVGNAGGLPAAWWRPTPWSGWSFAQLVGGGLVTTNADGTETTVPIVGGNAVGVNEAGQIAGGIVIQVGTSRFPRAALWDARAQVWRDQGRPVLENGALALGAVPRGINNHGHLTGQAQGAPVVWRDGTPTLLPRLEPGQGCQAFAINDVGQVAGNCGIAGEFIAVRWDGGHIVTLDSEPTELGSFGRAINLWGTVAGFDSHAEPDDPEDPESLWGGAAVLWYEHETPDSRLLADPGAGNGVNEWGDVAGYVGVNGGPSKAALWRGGRGAPVTYEPLAGDEAAWFRALNNTGLLVGFSTGENGSTAVYAQR